MSITLKVTPMHVLAYMYLYQSCLDGELADVEKRTIAQKIHKWIPGESITMVEQIVHESTDWLESAIKQDNTRQPLNQYLPKLKEKFTDEELHSIIEDLKEVAKSDGNFDETEEGFIMFTSIRLGLDPNA